MKKWLIIFCMCMSFAYSAKTRITIYNKDQEPILVSVGRTAMKPLEKDSIKARQAKNFFVEPLSQHQPLYLVISSSFSRWPQTFELKLMPNNEVVLQRGGLVVSRKVITGRQNVATTALKIWYYGNFKPAPQEIMFK